MANSQYLYGNSPQPQRPGPASFTPDSSGHYPPSSDPHYDDYYQDQEQEQGQDYEQHRHYQNQHYPDQRHYGEQPAYAAGFHHSRLDHPSSDTQRQDPQKQTRPAGYGYQRPQDRQHAFEQPLSPRQQPDSVPRSQPQQLPSEPPQAHIQASPQQEQTRPSTRGRALTAFSTKSRADSTLSRQDTVRVSKGLHSKADPTLAMNEAEPSAVAAMHSVQAYTPIRNMEHKDSMGNVIAEPDKSNPTRSRWERPLETIRNFERAIELEYNRKSIYMPSETGSIAAWNRQSSYFAQDNRRPRPNFDQRASFRPESTQFELSPPGRRSSYYGDGSGESTPAPRSQGWGPGPNRQRAPRMYSDNQRQHGQDQGVYGLQQRDRSYETVASAAASGSIDQAGYQTDPTSGSDNSSIERDTPAMSKPSVPTNDYGIGFSQPPDALAVTSPIARPVDAPRQEPTEQGPPSVPAKESSGNRISVLKRTPTTASNDGEKKRSWLKRRFSKRAAA